MALHVLARLTGFGLVVVPKEPYRIDRVTDAPETTLRVWHGDETAVADVSRESSTELVEVVRGGPMTEWRIETGVMSCAWPHGFALSSDPDGLSPFILFGPEDAMIWIAGPIEPAKATPIERLATDDQVIRAVAEAGDNARIDVDYEHDGERWWQRRYVIAWGEDRALVLSGQSRVAQEEITRAALDLVEGSIAPATSN